MTSQKAATNEAMMTRLRAAVPRGVAQATEIFPARAGNAEIWDLEERHYIDFAAGIAVLNTGHCHPRILAAARRQMEAFGHLCFQVTPYEPYVALAERMNALMPGAAAKKTIFLTTGAEAIENAVKIARYATQRSGIVAFSGGFHGRTFMSMALTGKVAPYKRGFGPLPGEVYHVPYPCELHGVGVADSLAALDALFRSEIAPERIAAVVIEPIQGEGGFYVAPAALLRRLRELCDEHGILLVFDEIQSGFGRTGRFFACEYSAVEPDLMTTAKAIGGGFPLSAVTGRSEVMDAAPPGGLGGTFAGSPVACAAALAVLEVIEEEQLLQRALAIGDILTRRLRAFAGRSRGLIAEVRGLGAMVALEIVKDRNSPGSSADITRAIVRRAADLGLILLSCGAYSNVIRILPPLTAADATIASGLDILERAMRDLDVLE